MQTGKTTIDCKHPISSVSNLKHRILSFAKCGWQRSRESLINISCRASGVLVDQNTRRFCVQLRLEPPTFSPYLFVSLQIGVAIPDVFSFWLNQVASEFEQLLACGTPESKYLQISFLTPISGIKFTLTCCTAWCQAARCPQIWAWCCRHHHTRTDSRSNSRPSTSASKHHTKMLLKANSNDKFDFVQKKTTEWEKINHFLSSSGNVEVVSVWQEFITTCHCVKSCLMWFTCFDFNFQLNQQPMIYYIFWESVSRT